MLITIYEKTPYNQTLFLLKVEGLSRWIADIFFNFQELDGFFAQSFYPIFMKSFKLYLHVIQM